MDESWASRLSAVAALDEPIRRRLYEYITQQPAPVSREEAADAQQMPRTTVAFHLERLVTEGLLEVVYGRRTGRSGPGAGRPAKLYRRSPRQVAISLPDRQYEVVGRLLADAVHESESSGESPRTILDRGARELGREMGAAARATHPTQAGHLTAIKTLETFGFEPRASDVAMILGNCPFHNLARRHTELVCGMNLCLLGGLLDGIAETGLTVRLEPAPGQCCVCLEPAHQNQ